ncbi:hypothetical protein NKZ05_08545 [Stutzerimonas stutzeri]|uniref:hypothetical protein n=1 Tax=Stutzerimonas stutzeri TaxID=316 RepID=UPI00387DC513
MSIKNMIEGLLELGYTQGSIAEAVGATQPTIHRALNGSDIRYTTGKAIESLYAQEIHGSAAALSAMAAPHKSAA